MAYVRTEHRRLPHIDSRSLLKRKGSGSGRGTGKRRTAKAGLKPKSQNKKNQLPPASSLGSGIVEAHTDDLVDKED